MEPKKANHQAILVKIEKINQHPDPETTNLEIIPIGEYQVVVRKGEFKVGDISIYIQPDSVVPQTEQFEFIWKPYLDDRANNPALCQHVSENGNSTILHHESNGLVSEVCIKCHMSDPYLVPEKKRRITVRKFRKEWSEGLLMPLTVFGIPVVNDNGDIGMWETSFKVGDDVSDYIGVTHYVPETDKESTKADKGAAPRRKLRYPKTFKGWVSFIWGHITGNRRQCNQAITVDFHIPEYDVESLKNYPHAFTEYEPVFVTEKIHGSNSRFMSLDGTMYAGSHYQWKKVGDGNNDVWNQILKQHPWVTEWCKTHEGCALYGEAVPTQGKFDYGCKKGEVKFFVFDVWDYLTDQWYHHKNWNAIGIPQDYIVPVLYVGPYTREKMQELVDGQSSVIGAKHAREGIVIKTDSPYRHVRGIGRLQLKLVSNKFLEKDN